MKRKVSALHAQRRLGESLDSIIERTQAANAGVDEAELTADIEAAIRDVRATKRKDDLGHVTSP